VRQFLSNENVPNRGLPPFERFTKFVGIIAEASKAQADRQKDALKTGPQVKSLSRETKKGE
jgi:hypothetical protein